MVDNNYLCHYGRIGMKWGQRKFHDKYGVMTPTGHARRTQLENEHDRLSNSPRLSKAGVQRKAEIEKQYSELTGKPIQERHQVPKPKVKPVNEMTNEELTAYNTRKQLEVTYQNFQPKQKESIGRQFAQTAFNKVIAPAAIDVGKKYLTKVAMDKLQINSSEKDKAAKAAKEAEKIAKEIANELKKQ